MCRLPLVCLLVLCCSACTSTFLVAKDSGQRTSYHLRQAVKVDLQCMALPWAVITETSPDSPSDALLSLSLAAGASAYGLIDLPFSYSAYGLHQAHNFARDAYDNLVDHGD